MLRLIISLITICIMSVPAVRAANCTGCKTLGGVDPQTVINYFKTESHPRLLFKYSNASAKAALLAKKDAGNAMLATIWQNAIAQHGVSYRVKSQPKAAGIYFALNGMSTSIRDLFIEKVNGYTPNARTSSPWNNYLDAADLATNLFAYDACANGISASDKAAFLAKVETYVAVARAECPIPGGTGNITENTMASVGLAAICFPDHPDAVEWLDHSLIFLHAAYQQMENQACIAEGPSYQVSFSYSAIVADLCMTLGEHGFNVVDAEDNFLDDVFLFIVKSMRPDKYSVDTEDCYNNSQPGNIWPARYMGNAEGKRALHWYLNHIGATGGIGNYIAYDLSQDVSRVPQWNPTQFIDQSSCAVFRTGFGGTDSWLYFLGDNMPFFFSNGGVGGWIHNKNHGHCDATSITLHAHGEYLLTESARFRGLTAKYHNLIMVDGNENEPSWGISSADKYTYMKNTFATDFMDGADMSIAYGNTDFIRSVLYAKELMTPAENEYFVIIDDVEAQDGTDHNYDLKFHNKRGDITGSGLKKWTTQTGNSLAEIHFMEPDLASVTRQQEDVGSGTYPSMDYVDHRILARKTGQSFQFVTFLYPRTTSMSSPTVTEVNGTYYKGGTIAIGSSEDIVLSQKGTQTETAGGIRSDGTQVLVRATSGSPAMYMLKNGTLIERDGKKIISSDVPVKIAALKYTSATAVTGVIEVEQAANITFYSQDGNISSWKFFDAGMYNPFSFNLASGGKVTGKVTDDDLGSGVPGVKVEAIAGSEVSYCYTDASGNYTFEWVRPGATTITFTRNGYTTRSVSGQNVVSGQIITLNHVLSITGDAPAVLNAAVLKTTNATAQIRVSSNKPCYNQIAYGTSTSYGTSTAKTAVYKEVDTVTISGLTGGRVYHYKVTVTDFDGRTGSSADLTFAPVGDFADDFNDSDYTPKWEASSASYWSETGGILKKVSSGNYAYDPKRLKDLILAKDALYSSFTLTCKGRSTRNSDKRDLSFVFNYEDDTHYYYAQFSQTADSEYNGIFKVNGTDKVKIGTSGAATLAGDEWVDIKIVRDLKNGAINVYCGDMTTPCFTATDYDMGLGRIALGSERSTVEFDDILIKPEAETGIRDAGVHLLQGPVTVSCLNPVTPGMQVTFMLGAETAKGDVAITLYDGSGNIVYAGLHKAAGRIAVASDNLPGGMICYMIETAVGRQYGRTVIVK